MSHRREYDPQNNLHQVGRSFDGAQLRTQVMAKVPTALQASQTLGTEYLTKPVPAGEEVAWLLRRADDAEVKKVFHEAAKISPDNLAWQRTRKAHPRCETGLEDRKCASEEEVVLWLLAQGQQMLQLLQVQHPHDPAKRRKMIEHLAHSKASFDELSEWAVIFSAQLGRIRAQLSPADAALHAREKARAQLTPPIRYEVENSTMVQTYRLPPFSEHPMPQLASLARTDQERDAVAIIQTIGMVGQPLLRALIREQSRFK